MSVPSASSMPGESDDDPDILQAGTNIASREHRGRVRFISNAATQQPQAPPLPSAAITSDQIQVPPRPHPILRGNSRDAVTAIHDHAEDPESAAAQIRANTMANRAWGTSTSSSRSSFDSTAYTETGDSENHLLRHDSNIPLQNLTDSKHEREASGESTNTFSRAMYTDSSQASPSAQDSSTGYTAVDTTERHCEKQSKGELHEIYNASYDGSYAVPKPNQYRGGVLSQLLKLSKQAEFIGSRQSIPESSCSDTPGHKRTPSGANTGATTPERRKWYDSNSSQDTLATLIGASANLAKPAQPQSDHRRPRPPHKRAHSMAGRLSQLLHQEEMRVKVHIAGTLARQEFILKLCRALMLYGAPTHRLEEYLTMTSRALEIEAQFLYIPGCMIISFDDTETHTTAVKLVRLAQGIDLGRLKDVHRIYKEVLHDVIGVEDATGQLDQLMDKKPKFHPWLRVLVFGITSVTAAPFSFSARLIDLPICFFFGCLVGTMQLILAPLSPLYGNVLEVSATVIVSFLARAFGSIRGGDLFCFSALAQGGIVMLLPGYMFLSSSLELQARAIVPGSIRIVYGIVYSLLLGFGITIGAALYGLMDQNATSNLTCSNPIPGLYAFIFVPFFVLCISMLYQSKWKQIPIMVVIAFAGYVVNYFSSLRFPTSPQIASGFGAFAVGTLANLYSRFRHGVAAAILVPAIFTQVPGGLASNGGLLSGLQVANEINNATNSINGTAANMGASMNPNYVVFNVASSMIQIAIGITVGLFMSALVVYPLGKRRSGLFSF
ncbi:hypothetical protein AC578_5152 [Pseudocercospora eumusae]|uniref:Threonine/serine exporter-like N-terminal domain-containing protein n=1 Tax=Pseudocercospora eumusae TaxID=321146 RepID=A0A139HMD5_9PEZI|nr:hypothetical protein AC578_5152 [Pseudocercospora eumusae]